MCFRRTKKVDEWKARTKATSADLTGSKLEFVVDIGLLYIANLR